MASTNAAPVRRGRRVALPPKPEPVPEQGKMAERVYVVAPGKDLRFEGRWVPAGVEIPGAAGWHRVEAWVEARRIRLLAPDEEYTTYLEWVTPHLEAEAAESRRLLEAAEAAQQAEDEAAKQKPDPEEE